MKTNPKRHYDGPEAKCFDISLKETVLAGSYVQGGGGSYDPDDIIDNGEY